MKSPPRPACPTLKRIFGSHNPRKTLFWPSGALFCIPDPESRIAEGMQTGPGKSPRRYRFLSFDLRRWTWHDWYCAVASWCGPNQRHAGRQAWRQEHDLLSTNYGQTVGRMCVRGEVTSWQGDLATGVLNAHAADHKSYVLIDASIISGPSLGQDPGRGARPRNGQK